MTSTPSPDDRATSPDPSSDQPSSDEPDPDADTSSSRAQALADRAARTWTNALFRAGRWADEIDAAAGGSRDEVDPAAGLEPADVGAIEHALEDAAEDVQDPLGPGTPASVWAVAKATIGLVGAPVTVPTMTVAALRTARITSARIATYPEHLHALAEDREPPLPGHRTMRLPSSTKYLITSDLHRCIPGRLDWPERQGVKPLYLDVLESYASDGWSLIENGDVEDFWMVGGSTWGAVYDVAYLTGGAVGPGRGEAKRTILTEQLDRIVQNNSDIYRMLRENFCAEGRYFRTMGNHDDAFTDPFMAEYLRHHLPGTELADTILLSADGAGPAEGIAGVDAVVAHGHLTDSWNGHGFAPLGRAITWLITGLDDLPRIPKVDGLPDEEGLSRLLGGRARNRLISVDPRYGGNRRFDSLDEERLFASLAAAEPESGWPWIVFGHTHFPMLWPHNKSREPVKYANSGCGVLDGAFSALEWDASDPDAPLTLVVWVDDLDGPRRVELVPDGPTFLPA